MELRRTALRGKGEVGPTWSRSQRVLPALAASAALLAATASGASDVLIAIHADPCPAVGCDWNRLEQAVDAAAARGHRLTLMFSRDWMQEALDDYDRRAGLCTATDGCLVARIAALVARGHQISFHHHDCTHAFADGTMDPYLASVNAAGAEFCEAGAGFSPTEDVDLAYQKVQAVSFLVDLILGPARPPDTFPDVASHGPNQPWNGGSLNLEAFEWQPANRFATNSVDDSPFGAGGHAFLMAATCSTPVGDGTATWSVPQLGHRQLETGSSLHGTYGLADLADEVDALFHGPLVGSEAHIGVVFHVVEYERSPRLCSPPSLPGMSCADYIDRVFDLLATRAAPARTASAILGDAVRAGLVCP